MYNATDQKDDAENRYDWMMNHQTLLSPAYEFTQEDGTAGFSDSRRINLYLFSNRLNIKPVFENAPADLTVYGYELVASNGYNGTYDAFVTEAEIKIFGEFHWSVAVGVHDEMSRVEGFCAGEQGGFFREVAKQFLHLPVGTDGHFLRMPLHAEYGMPRRAFHRLDDSVGRGGADAESGGGLPYGLVVERVDS